MDSTFTIGGNKPYLLGIMHGFYAASPREIIEVSSQEVKEMYQENSGIAIVFPSWRLREIFQQPDFLNKMKQLEKSINN